MIHLNRHRPHGETIRLERWHRIAIHGIALALAASGLLWLVFHYFIHTQGAFGVKPHPLTAWWLRLHGAAAMLALVGAGSLTLTHMRRAWRTRRNRWCGGALAVVTMVLAVTGYLLYYASAEETRTAMSLTHWAIGIIAIGLLPLHVRRGRNRSRGNPHSQLVGQQSAAVSGIGATVHPVQTR